MSELAMRSHDLAAQPAPVDVGDIHKTAAPWLFDWASPSPFRSGRTIVVTVAEPVLAITAVTGLASGDPSELGESIETRAWPRQVTRIPANPPDSPRVTVVVDSLLATSSWTHSTHDLSGVLEGTGFRSLEPPTPAATVVLRELMRWMGGSAELVAQSLGASRRSIYNWLKGKPVRSGFGARAARLKLVLEPLGENWHPDVIADWLQSGDPPPSELAANERWSELAKRVRSALRPIPPQPDEGEITDARADEHWPPEAFAATLVEFNSPPPARPRTTEWQPREFTGSTPGVEEE